MGKKRLIVALLLISTGLMAGAFAWADDSKGLKNVQGQIANQKQDLQQQKKQLSRLQQRLAKDEKAISALARELNQTQHKLKENETALARLDKEHQTLGKQAEQQQHLLAEQLRAAYRNGRHDYLKLLLNGQDSTEIDRLLHYYAHLNQARAQALQQLTRTREQLADNRRRAEQSRNQLNQLLARQEAERQKLSAQQAKRSQTAKQLNAALDQSNQRLANLQQAASHLERQIKAAQQRAAREQAAREQAAREQAERNRLARQQGGSGRTPVVAKPSGSFAGLAKGTLPWPLKGSLIHRFGAARTSQLNWKGLLISAPVGREVSAIANGQVVYADWLSGFGMVMVIDHGKGYMSLYGHNQSLLRNPGDQVKAGQPIALSGESGGQDKSGLYFEIRYRGQAIDPQPWLRRG
ncbi:septal ring factor EnvC (AmiA/AmiB activator) [Oceanisphaera litoralis]|uniref:murein hydrolase activator EnvC n=1 Tax=Oceanisphaera litoralis TaxID=225144 RepID=UPI00195E6E0B|nr:murein hydrolase activator EnvC [Oceanisphaera litoralis]MBM7457181.1 septal ring factor EnvC (AmiA/AmiB activator) [Oceanisphaera litoralis]